MIKDLLQKKKEDFLGSRKTEDANLPRPEIDDKIWAKCNECNKALYEKMLKDNLMVCPLCNHHFRLNNKQRVEQIFDEGTFNEIRFDIEQTDPLNFPGYKEKIQSNQENNEIDDAAVCGVGHIRGVKVACCIMDSFFMMGSMGYHVGESVTRIIEHATANKLPIVIFTSSGGARMQEGIVSLMQMAKISGALEKLAKENLLYITVITHPTTGGVTASFASLGDIIVAERGALIGFAGKRVIEQTIKQKLPKDFQTAEFAADHGFVDVISERKDLPALLGKVLKIHCGASEDA